MLSTCPSILDVGTGSFIDLLVYPSLCWPYFWTVIMFGLWATLSSIMYSSEQKRYFQSDFLSAAAVGGIAVTVLSAIGSLIQSSDGIPVIPQQTLLAVLAVTIIFVVVWFFRGD